MWCACSASLQVSRLTKPGGSGAGGPPAAQHWFTATPDPRRGVFKPFAFPGSNSGGSGDGGSNGTLPVQASPYTAAQPARRNPPHALWKAWRSVHESRGGGKPAAAALRDLEARGLDPGSSLTFAAAVEEEMRLYGSAV